MHFSTHIKLLREALRACLSAPKPELLSELQKTALKAKRLLNSSEFDFYIEQFEQLELEEFATTQYAVDQVAKALNLPTETENTRDRLIFEVSLACENLLAYTVDDFCEAQSVFHWYYSLNKGFAYKVSELGAMEMPNGENIVGNSRVAKISELPFEFRRNLI